MLRGVLAFVLAMIKAVCVIELNELNVIDIKKGKKKYANEI